MNIDTILKIRHNTVMYIIQTLSKSRTNSTKKYYTYRLVESVRIGKQVKRRTLLNLKSDFSVPKEQWSELSTRIDDILHKRQSLFELDEHLESLAQQYALKIIAAKQHSQSDTDNMVPQTHSTEIDTTTITNSDARSVGVEHLLYETIKVLKLDTFLESLGLRSRQVYGALGTLIAKCAHPTSDAQTYRWLCDHSAAGELMGCDFNTFSSNTIYRIADSLLEHKAKIEPHLYKQQ